MIITFIINFLILLITSSPTVCTGDSGELITASKTLGIGHPPGYPLYVLLGKIFSIFIPFGNIAYRVNCMSVFFGALSCGIIYLIIKELLLSDNSAVKNSHIFIWFCSFATAFSLAFSHNFWSQCVQTKGGIYTLNAFFMTIIIYSLIADKNILLIIFLCGIGLGNHHTLSLYFPGIFLYLILIKKISFSFKKINYYLLFFVIGFSVYLYLFLRSQQHPVDNWDNPGVFENFLRVVFRIGYGGVMHIEEKGGYLLRPFSLFLQQIWEYIRNVYNSSTIIGFFIGIFGLMYSYKRNRKIFWCLLMIFIFSGPFFMFLANKPVNEDTRDLLEPFHIPSIIIFSIWIGLALSYITKKVKWTPLFITIFLVFLFSSNFQKNNLRYNFFPYDLGKNILKTVPDNSMIFLDKADESVFILAYMKLALKNRPAVDVYDCNASAFPNIYGDRYYWIKGRDRTMVRLPIERKMIQENNKNVYYLSENPNYFNDMKFSKIGLLNVLGRKMPNYNFSDIYALRENRFRYRDTVLAYSYHLTLANYYIETNQKSLVKTEFENMKILSKENISADIAYLYYNNGLFDEAIEEYKLAIVKEPQKIEYYNNLGTILNKQKRFKDAILVYLKAIEISPYYVDAHYNLAVTYWESGNWTGVINEFEKVLQIDPKRTDVIKFIETAKLKL
ncbi:MAG: hypothetical protein A2539_10155 [Elusimicrobia bacterium RIFOXYD2_FULL_34_15]|nr:MAG: hypothetical protein A2539_10155 [Elusimicrobia bacterium RIFOXYD2_FULL_34_15]